MYIIITELKLNMINLILKRFEVSEQKKMHFQFSIKPIKKTLIKECN